MLALGIDISTRKIAVVGITERGDLHTHAIGVPAGRTGAQRLCVMRTVLASSLKAERWQDTCVALVEIPWAAGSSSFALLSATGVVLETVQAQFPGAIVMDVPTPSWKRETVGHGMAPKQDCMTYAQGIGYDGTDQDLADAACMASAAWGRWHAQVGTAA